MKIQKMSLLKLLLIYIPMSCGIGSVVFRKPYDYWEQFILVGVGISLLHYLVFIISNRRHEQIPCIHKLIGKSNDINLLNLKSESEFLETWKLEKSLFDDSAASPTKALSWWKRFQKGVFVVRQNGLLVGYMAFWPLAKKSFHDFISGFRTEPELEPGCIGSNPFNKATSYWYIGTIALITSKQKTTLTRDLILHSIDSWISNFSPDSQLHLCALAYHENKEPEKLLKRLGFIKHSDRNENRHHQSVYTKITTAKQFKDEVFTLFGNAQSVQSIKMAP